MNIIMLPIEKIYPHPNNPRTDLGDLTELTDSIRAMGILQNLTVVPYDATVHKGIKVRGDGSDCFVAVAGNRRLAAATKAKLKEVPAVISTMDFKQQNRVMLVENLQRETLSVFQQAKTIQLMLDLGDTVQDIAKQTGFSESTVRNRAKLTVFAPDKMEEVEGRGATIKDYLDLAKIEDDVLRNEVLGSIGTANFRNDLARAKATLRDRKNREEQITVLQSFAQKIDASAADGMKFLRTLYSSDAAEKIAVPGDKNTVKYFFVVGNYGISLYREKTAADDMAENARQLLAAELKGKSVAIKESTERAKQLRKDFAMQLSAARVKQLFGAVVSTLSTQMVSFARDGYTMVRLNNELLHDLTGVPLDKKNEVDADELRSAAEKNPEWIMFAVCFAMLETGTQAYYTEDWVRDCGYAYVHCQNEKLDRCYELLTTLGYAMSEEEKRLKDGSHSMFFVKPAAQ